MTTFGSRGSAFARRVGNLLEYSLCVECASNETLMGRIGKIEHAVEATMKLLNGEI